MDKKIKIKKTKICGKIKKIKSGDTVFVIAGKNTGKTGVVKKVFPSEFKIIVEGINIVTKHNKPSSKNEGGIEKKEMPIHVSNVAYFDPETGPTRVGFKFLKDGRKVRVAKKSGKQID